MFGVGLGISVPLIIMAFTIADIIAAIKDFFASVRDRIVELFRLVTGKSRRGRKAELNRRKSVASRRSGRRGEEGDEDGPVLGDKATVRMSTSRPRPSMTAAGGEHRLATGTGGGNPWPPSRRSYHSARVTTPPPSGSPRHHHLPPLSSLTTDFDQGQLSAYSRRVSPTSPHHHHLQPPAGSRGISVGSTGASISWAPGRPSFERAARSGWDDGGDLEKGREDERVS